MTGLDMNREYFVPALANDEGEYTGPRGHEHPQLGRVVLLFTTKERLDVYLAHSDENQAFLDILERAPEHVGSEALNLGYYIKTTVQELLPKLQAHDVEYLYVDPLNPGGYNRGYPLPHKG